MLYAYHQNMRVFGGGAAARNNAYSNAFTTLRATIGGGNGIAAAGFTELVNYPTALLALQQLGARMGCPSVMSVACGRTALANGPEYVGMAFSSAPQSVGRILIQASGRGINLIHEIAPMVPPPAQWCQSLNVQATLDYRGVVYAAVRLGRTTVAVGFLHNRYADGDTRALIAGLVPQFCAMMRQNPAVNGGPSYLGGDFNVAPLRRPGAGGPCSPYSRGLYPPLPAGMPPLPPGWTPGGTTAAGNLYDYWYLNDGAPAPMAPVASVFAWTLDLAMSDHCGTLLQVAP
jgi:hypothetical protein